MCHPARHRRWRSSSLIGLLVTALALVSHAQAAPLVARYEVRAAGFRVMEVEAAFDLEGSAYRVRTRVRLVGPATTFGGGDQVTEAEGGWRDGQAFPRQYRVSGFWRGSRRAVAIDWTAAGMPRVATLEPPVEPDREAVPDSLRQGSVDSLSALARLLRLVADTGRCDATAPVFDGRRRFDYAVRTGRVEALPGGSAFPGAALRCDVEYRLVAGRRTTDEPEEAGRTLPATVWLARVPPAALAVPVRIELPTGWIGTVRVLLLSLEVGGEPAPR